MHRFGVWEGREAGFMGPDDGDVQRTWRAEVVKVEGERARDVEMGEETSFGEGDVRQNGLLAEPLLREGMEDMGESRTESHGMFCVGLAYGVWTENTDTSSRIRDQGLA